MDGGLGPGLSSVWFCCSLGLEGWRSTPAVITETLGSEGGRMPSTSPGDQDHTGHLRWAGVVLLLLVAKLLLQLQAHFQWVSGEFQSLLAPGPVTCFPSILGQCHLQFYLLKCLFSTGPGERGLIASHPPGTLFTLMFTAPKLSTVSRAPPLPAHGELTVSIGLRTTWGQRLHSKSLQPLSFSLFHLLTALESTDWLLVGFSEARARITL